MLSREFLTGFKRETEEKWRDQIIDPLIHGFQFQAGTRWRSGLSDEQILAYEDEIGIRFPSDLRAFLGEMNGTDLVTINIFGSSGEASREGIGVYSYPRDIESVRNCIANAVSDKEMLIVTLADQGFSLAPTAGLMPIYAHRFVVCDGDPETSIVLSVWDSEDAIIYGYSLQEYLEREFLGKIPSWAA